ncbi:MAG: hypothetical protein KGM46_07175 [Pseudomonadota bacterium]|jgi:hypothetical protein|nr:hypothetical protein [Xanthomonadaceae bacterium]MDE2247579.1 hypothetical protein [Xanthomonadaceae bacterium]MDE3210507.1 hypothetical protein [Pseudomonadota bacterium]
MTKPTTDSAMFTDTSSSVQQPTPTDQDPSFEQQLAGLNLSSSTKQFLQKVHLAEKKLNDAFDAAHQQGDLEERVSHVYHDMYRSR